MTIDPADPRAAWHARGRTSGLTVTELQVHSGSVIVLNRGSADPDFCLAQHDDRRPRHAGDDVTIKHRK